MMMSLDQFVFSLTSAPFKELQRQHNWKHRTSSRVGDFSDRKAAGQLQKLMQTAVSLLCEHLRTL